MEPIGEMVDGGIIFVDKGFFFVVEREGLDTISVFFNISKINKC
jgi:hypothetical protein